jgi:hypothetical protein
MKPEDMIKQALAQQNNGPAKQQPMVLDFAAELVPNSGGSMMVVMLGVRPVSNYQINLPVSAIPAMIARLQEVEKQSREPQSKIVVPSGNG